MPSSPSAIGYLRSDISGARQRWDETQIRHTAARFGYNLLKIIVFSARTDRVMHRLHTALDRAMADAIVTPSLRHFESAEAPAELLAVAAVITVTPERMFARWVAPTKPAGGLK
ncbi:hypothetical protein [Nocardia acidivorans]|uniref:hypothetical protein n=1 Tax=Nocardia acidivorans TaxID=404580 RepID=UPI0009FC0F13|nr:hypothetical protein [Nocardia acidivorans]